MLAQIVRLATLLAFFPVVARAAVPVPLLQIELRNTPSSVVVGGSINFDFLVRNVVTGSDLVFGPRYRLSGVSANFDGDSRDVFHASFQSTDSVAFQLRGSVVGRAVVALTVDYTACDGVGPCVPASSTQSFVIDVVSTTPTTVTATPSGTRGPTTVLPSPSPTPTASPSTGLVFDLVVSPAQPVVGDLVTFTFTALNVERGIIAQQLQYRLSGLLPNYDWDMAAVNHAVLLRTGDRDTIQYTFRALHDGEAQVRIRADYLACAATQCSGGFSQSGVFPVVSRGSALTPASTASIVPTVTPTATVSPPTSTPSAINGTPTPTPSAVTGLTIDLAVYPAQPVVGDVVSFVFTVRNLQTGVLVQRPTYRLSGLSPNYSGSPTEITRDVSISGPQTDTVQFTLQAARDGISDVRLLVDYLECRGSQCGGAFSASSAFPILTRGSQLTPVPTITTTPTSTARPTSTSTPTLSALPSATSTATVKSSIVPSSTSTPIVSPTASPTPTGTLAITPTRTGTAGPITTPAVTFSISIVPPQPVVGDDVTVRFTIANPQGPSTLRRETYVVSGVSPNFDGNVTAVTRDVAILGSQTDTITYQLKAVNEGTSLLQIHVTYEACGSTLPCPFGSASSPIFSVGILKGSGSPTPQRSGTPTATARTSTSPTPTGSTTPQPTPFLTYDLDVEPLQPLVGDDVRVSFTVRNVRSGTYARRPNYQVSGTTPNLEGNILSLTHDVAIGSDTFDLVEYQFRAVHEGTTLLQLHTTYDTCVNDDPCSFGNSSSPIYRVVIRDRPEPTSTPVWTESPTPTGTVTPTAPTPTATETAVDTPTPTPTATLTPRLVIVNEGSCSLSTPPHAEADGAALWIVGLLGLTYRRRGRTEKQRSR